MNCREFEELISDALYGELAADDRKRFDAHADSCPACAVAYTEMQSTLGVMEKRERPDPGQAYWDSYWNRLSARMETAEAQRQSRSWLARLFPGLSPQGMRWAYRGALAVMLIAFGAVLGRMVLPGSDHGSQGTPGIGIVEAPPENGSPADAGVTSITPAPTIQMASAEACAHQYIDDTQVLLLGLLNYHPGTEGEYIADWSVQKMRSRELINQAGSIKGDLKDPKQRRLRELVTELEFILLQIATLETTGDLESVEMIKSSVKDRGVLFKINLEKLRSDDTEKPEPGACGVHEAQL
jgi:hypothetical protein